MMLWREMRRYLMWEHTRHTPDDLLELVGVCRVYAEKRCIKHPQLAKF